METSHGTENMTMEPVNKGGKLGNEAVKGLQDETRVANGSAKVDHSIKNKGQGHGLGQMDELGKAGRSRQKRWRCRHDVGGTEKDLTFARTEVEAEGRPVLLDERDGLGSTSDEGQPQPGVVHPGTRDGGNISGVGRGRSKKR